MDIREAKNDDLQAIYELIDELEATHFEFTNFEKGFRFNSNQPNIYYYVAEHLGLVVGFISIHTQFLLHHNGFIGEIQELIVSEKYRGKGIGQKLIKKAIELAETIGMEQLEVTTNIKRERTHQFYRKNNFIETSKKFVINKKSWQ